MTFLASGKIETIVITPLRTIKKSTTRTPNGTKVKTITYIGKETEIHRPWNQYKWGIL